MQICVLSVELQMPTQRGTFEVYFMSKIFDRILSNCRLGSFVMLLVLCTRKFPEALIMLCSQFNVLHIIIVLDVLL